MNTRNVICSLASVLILTSCTRVVVRKNPGQLDRGIRYYRPKPYLFITPDTSSSGKKPTFSTTVNTTQNDDLKLKLSNAQAQGIVRGNVDLATHEFAAPEMVAVEQLSDGSQLGQPAPGTTTRATTPLPGSKISISMMYLPDFAEEYSIRLMPGLGIGELNIKLDNGWNLTSVGMKTDQQTDEIIKSTADLVGSLGGLFGSQGTEGRFRGGGVSILATNVPFGFYEAVIAEDCYGRKQLYGWRYIGFMPFQACPVEPCGIEEMPCQDPSAIFGLVIDSRGVLRFEKLAHIPHMPIDNTQAGVTTVGDHGGSKKPVHRPSRLARYRKLQD